MIDLNISLGASSMLSKMLLRGRSSVQRTAGLQPCGCLSIAYLFLFLEKKDLGGNEASLLPSFSAKISLCMACSLP